MGLPEEPTMIASPAPGCRRGGLDGLHGRDEYGFALAATLVVLVIISVLVAGAWSMMNHNNRASSNRTSSLSALEVAEAGTEHALALLRHEFRDQDLSVILKGPDGDDDTSDDGILAGWGFASADEIPAAGRSFGGGTYWVEVVDDPADGDGDPYTDTNDRVVVQGRGVTADGAEARVRAIVGSKPVPAIATQGDMEISGDAHISGYCGQIHGNQDLYVSGDPTVTDGISASDSVRVGGSVSEPDGDPVEPEHSQPQVDIPTMTYDDYCGEADFVLHDSGMLEDKSTGLFHDGSSTSETTHGWKWGGSAKWELTKPENLAEGTFCVETNAIVGTNPGESSGSAVALSIIAKGSIEISGNPVMYADHSDGILLLAEGDLKIGGNPTAYGDNYDGMMYAGAQCMVSGNPMVVGSLLCADGSEPAVAENYVDANSISGEASFQYDCRGVLGQRRYVGWYQSFGS